MKSQVCVRACVCVVLLSLMSPEFSSTRKAVTKLIVHHNVISRELSRKAYFHHGKPCSVLNERLSFHVQLIFICLVSCLRYWIQHISYVYAVRMYVHAYGYAVTQLVQTEQRLDFSSQLSRAMGARSTQPRCTTRVLAHELTMCIHICVQTPMKSMQTVYLYTLYK